MPPELAPNSNPVQVLTAALERSNNLLLLYSGPAFDAIALVPALRSLQMAFSTANLTLLTVEELEAEARQGLQPFLLCDPIALPNFDQPATWPGLIQTLQAFDFAAAIVFTHPGRSPFSLAYLCYLAGVPVRIGQSQEFGGGVLSHCIKPAGDSISDWVSPIDHHLYLLRAIGLETQSSDQDLDQNFSSPIQSSNFVA